MCSGLKKTPAEVGEMSLPDAVMLKRYWTKYPHMLFGASPIGGGGASSGVGEQSTERYATQEDVAMLVQQYGRK